jgi:NADPH-dependent 2,4-dienoyl-CoA reductase/sulfur reductase-like enzyme
LQAAHVECLLNAPVSSVDLETKQVYLENVENRPIKYDQLLIATGVRYTKALRTNISLSNLLADFKYEYFPTDLDFHNVPTLDLHPPEAQESLELIFRMYLRSTV